MKIIIESPDINKEIKFPSGLVLNSLAATAAPLIIRKKSGAEFSLTGRQLRPLIREINRFRKKHRDWVLVDVEDGKSGERVVIKL